ncbi:MAG: glycosyltransferase, partial [Cyanobacteriota bacterium]|nr:glycosyltransferase [Cyanobacteriota bacterium]
AGHGRDWKRLFKRLLRAFLLPKKVRDNLWVWSPLVIPAASGKLSQNINKVLLSLTLGFYRSLYCFRSAILWTYNPLSLLYVKPNRFIALIYHCVDEISAQPGMNKKLIQTQERKLCSLADHVFVTSSSLYSSRSRWTKRITYLPNVVDSDHFSKGRLVSTSMPFDFESIPEPRLIFVGALSSYKVDFDLIQKLAVICPNWSIVLIGLVGEGDPNTSINQLMGIKNIYMLGPKSYKDLPILMHFSNVGLLPCVLNQYTRAMFPMKFFEYLAAGLPVVSTRLPSLEEFAEYISFANTAEEFASKINQILLNSSHFDERRIKNLVSRHSYRKRTEAMIKTIKQVLS